jgi:hypothetical protein
MATQCTDTVQHMLVAGSTNCAGRRIWKKKVFLLDSAVILMKDSYLQEFP